MEVVALDLREVLLVDRGQNFEMVVSILNHESNGPATVAVETFSDVGIVLVRSLDLQFAEFEVFQRIVVGSFVEFGRKVGEQAGSTFAIFTGIGLVQLLCAVESLFGLADEGVFALGCAGGEEKAEAEDGPQHEFLHGQAPAKRYTTKWQAIEYIKTKIMSMVLCE